MSTLDIGFSILSSLITLPETPLPDLITPIGVAAQGQTGQHIFVGLLICLRKCH